MLRSMAALMAARTDGESTIPELDADRAGVGAAGEEAWRVKKLSPRGI
jgi:hypothetical protein